MQMKFVQSNAYKQLIQGAGVPRNPGYAEGHHYIKTGNYLLQLLKLLSAAKLRRMTWKKKTPQPCCENRNVENCCREIGAVSCTIRPLSRTHKVRKLVSVISLRSITLFKRVSQKLHFSNTCHMLRVTPL